jgi:hypothetical protein
VLFIGLVDLFWLPAEDDRSQFTRFQTRRRSKLPAVNPESDVGLWSLLYKNIGKDLSKISMPVSLNEPLNALQVSLNKNSLRYSSRVRK